MVYVRYHFPDQWNVAADVDSYVLRCSMSGAFGGSSDNLVDALTARLANLKRFELEEVFDVVRGQGRTLELPESRLWQMGYGSDTVHLLFNLWYRQFNYTPAYEGNMPQVDHIYPQSILRNVKAANPRTGRMDLMKYRDADRNQLANCMLLTREENGAGGKWDTSPEVWFAGKSLDYLDMHLIPRDSSLWQVERFEDFITARKTLIRERFANWISEAKVSG